MTFGQEKKKFGVISATSLPTEEELSDFYSKTYFQDSVATTYQQDYSESELVHKRLLADQIIYGITAYRKPAAKASFLDVGCGEGFILNAARQAGFDVTGIDFSRHGLESQ
jgi:2-polyprenyl-3-methyl-5-hydroxy-6-metoxy-1,4-benzoquinol methylase